MRINNNLMAMNTHRQYAINNDNVAKSVEKLSSGYRINRAGDDAAGLAISEKMRAQIRGLNMASKNSQDAISLIQTAEGALQESHNILQRMRELAVQSASDTNETTIDRDALNKEFQALLEEIDDTAAKTKFNDLGLIDGTFSKYTATAVPATLNTVIAPAKATTIYVDALAHGATGPTGATPIEFDLVAATDPGDPLPGGGNAGANPVITYSYTDSVGVTKTINVNLFAGQTRLQLENGVSIEFSEPLDADFGNLATIFADVPATVEVDILETGFEFIVQTGANKGDELKLNIDKMDSKTLGVYGADIASRENASWAIQHVNNAVNTVSTQRAALGAMQNRMEHKIANLDTSAENLQSAEARIRDLDMAKEMTTFTKNNILSQAATAMLAQANSLPQGVLQLLQ